MAKKPTAGKRTSKRAAKPEVEAGRPRNTRNVRKEDATIGARAGVAYSLFDAQDRRAHSQVSID